MEEYPTLFLMLSIYTSLFNTTNPTTNTSAVTINLASTSSYTGYKLPINATVYNANSFSGNRYQSFLNLGYANANSVLKDNINTSGICSFSSFIQVTRVSVTIANTDVTQSSLNTQADSTNFIKINSTTFGNSISQDDMLYSPVNNPGTFYQNYTTLISENYSSSIVPPSTLYNANITSESGNHNCLLFNITYTNPTVNGAFTKYFTIQSANNISSILRILVSIELNTGGYSSWFSTDYSYTYSNYGCYNNKVTGTNGYYKIELDNTYIYKNGTYSTNGGLYILIITQNGLNSLSLPLNDITIYKS